MTTSSQIKVLLADGHSLFREAVKAVLKNEDDLDVVADAGDGNLAINEALRVQPDVALIDAGLPNCNGIAAAVSIKERAPECKVLILSDEQDEAILIAAINAGASGYMTKRDPLAELIHATRAVHRGETLIPPRMLGTLLAHLVKKRRQAAEAHRLVSRLTRREREVLALLVEGADNDYIARALVISPQTARTHIQNILGKLRVHSRLEASAFVINNDIKDELMSAEL